MTTTGRYTRGMYGVPGKNITISKKTWRCYSIQEKTVDKRTKGTLFGFIISLRTWWTSSNTTLESSAISERINFSHNKKLALLQR